MRKLTAGLAGLLVLVVANVAIYQKEQLLESGRTVLLELAPVDPRSLMQGDYMALRFGVTDVAFAGRPADAPANGRLVLALDGRGVGTFVRFDDGTPLGPNEVVMRYRIRAGQPRFGSNAYFFQEGTADRYTNAQFGEFRVAPDGDAILTGLRDQQLNELR